MAERQHRKMDRRSFMRRAGGTALALPTASAILAACSKPGTTGDATGSSGPVDVARPGDPVTLPLHGEPIPTDTPIEAGATLQVYNWSDYFYRKVLAEFEDQYDVKIEWTTFNNMEEGIQKLVAGQVKPDVFFPTTDYISRLVQTDLLQPLNHDLLPNMANNVWPSFSDPGPWYDQGWQYTVPYVIYTTGRGLSPRPHRRQRRAGEGLRAALGPRVHGQDQLLRLLPRRPGHGDAPQRRPRPQQRRSRRDRPGPRGGQRYRGAPPGQAHDQRHLRETARGRVLRQPGVVR